MFKNLQRELNRLANTSSISIPLESDSDGFFDKECPDQKCLFQFKIHTEDWKNIVRDEEVFCPSCRHVAPATSWYTRKQIEEGREYALNSVKAGINKAMRADAAESKRRQRRNSFLSITLEVKGGHDVVLLPVAAADPMRLRTTCESCQCRYSYIGAAFFCPSCGKNSASHTFAQTLATIRTAATLGDSLRANLGPDEAEVITRTLLEKAMQDTVMSFQRLCEQLHEIKAGPKARRNAFQNLEAGSELWAQTIGASYDQLVDIDTLQKLTMYFQQRHLLAHQQGIVDADYITRSGDTSYATGQRLIVHSNVVLEFADLIEKLGQQIIARC
ncbi:hypothetical protein G6L26_007085 [Agrobacterium radiobacter]|uniref:Uncharacterized protein n=1 Tax=Agrobacterium tumefaciens str. B6 TaxID=1183423 RepID=A0A822UXV4_AGRTU|nr:hypothetical protein [Agrobacterium tumefaciens]KWT83983.1 hypothetical protein ASB65_26715 [Agrobacterium tumefaciens str. B6]MQB28822.1 hypothetical protein [Agrobacterium tumefaciens]NTA08782.1 hypothetical protein [Agrobacterium tumefaciens]NTA95230.1 hypothetical protein [Agrobacterium tumefaciens]NTB16428.1 hypothetical protein [Agrobacterium tumefaciens]